MVQWGCHKESFCIGIRHPKCFNPAIQGKDNKNRPFWTINGPLQGPTAPVKKVDTIYNEGVIRFHLAEISDILNALIQQDSVKPIKICHEWSINGPLQGGHTTPMKKVDAMVRWDGHKKSFGIGSRHSKCFNPAIQGKHSKNMPFWAINGPLMVHCKAPSPRWKNLMLC